MEKLSDSSCDTPPLLSLSLAITVIHTYDRVVAETVGRSTVIYNFTGKLILYRIIQDHAWLLFNNVILNIEQESKNKKRKKPRRRAGNLKSDVVLLRCYNPYADLKYEAVTEEEVCPYTVEVTKRVKVKRKKISVNKKVPTVGSYDPTLHATSLTASTDYSTGADWRKPMPYNEKLRRAQTDGEKRDLGQTQVGLVDVLKGRYRKRAVEYPHRLVICV